MAAHLVSHGPYKKWCVQSRSGFEGNNCRGSRAGCNRGGFLRAAPSHYSCSITVCAGIWAIFLVGKLYLTAECRRSKQRMQIKLLSFLILSFTSVTQADD